MWIKFDSDEKKENNTNLKSNFEIDLSVDEFRNYLERKCSVFIQNHVE